METADRALLRVKKGRALRPAKSNREDAVS